MHAYKPQATDSALDTIGLLFLMSATVGFAIRNAIKLNKKGYSSLGPSLLTVKGVALREEQSCGDHRNEMSGMQTLDPNLDGRLFPHAAEQRAAIITRELAIADTVISLGTRFDLG